MYGLENIKVRDIMTRGVITLPITASVREVCKTLSESKISAVIITLPDGEIMGMISETDLILKFDLVQNIDKTIAKDIMTTTNIITIDPEQSVADAFRIMKENKIHRLIVTAMKGTGAASERPVGIISASDIIRLIAKY